MSPSAYLAMAVGSIVGGTSLYFSIKGVLVILTDAPVYSAIVQGRGLSAFVDADKRASIVRKDLNGKLRAILAPKDIINLYAVVVGDNGSGKSTAVRKVIASLDEPRGVVYFDAPPNSRQFSIELAKTIGFKQEMFGGLRRYLSPEDRDPGMNHEPLATFYRRLKPDLLEAASAFKRKYGRPLVLVIDSADRLAERHPEFLKVLQYFAKDCADKGTLRMVFISSDGSALRLLQSNRSAWSRGFVLEVNEISDEDAVKYLITRGVPDPDAKRAVQELTGGLFSELNKYVLQHSTDSIEALREAKDRAIDKELLMLGLPVNHPVLLKIHEDTVIGTNTALRLGLSKETIDLLLAKNILAAHANATYTFHGRHVANFFARMLKEEKKQADLS